MKKIRSLWMCGFSARIGLVLLCAALTACTTGNLSTTNSSDGQGTPTVKNPVEPPEPLQGGANICVVVPPQSYLTESAKDAGASLSIFGSKGISVRAKAEFDAKATQVFQELP